MAHRPTNTCTFFQQCFVGKNCANSCFNFFFFNFAITFDSGTLKKPIVPHLKDFFSINKFVFKECQFLHYFNPKSGKFGELQNFVNDCSCILGKI